MTSLSLPAVALLLGLLGAAHKLPPHDQVARVARVIAHQCDWASMATVSSHEPVVGQPFSNVFSVSDGPSGSGSGVPYLYLTRLELSVQDLQCPLLFSRVTCSVLSCSLASPVVSSLVLSRHLSCPLLFSRVTCRVLVWLQVTPQASLSMSLAQTDYCRQQGFDPQSPLCAHIILSGSVLEVNGTELSFAKNALFSRHPEMIDWPSDHNWFFAKFNITQVWVLDYFGGVKTVSPEEYFQASPNGKHH